LTIKMGFIRGMSICKGIHIPHARFELQPKALKRESGSTLPDGQFGDQTKVRT